MGASTNEKLNGIYVFNPKVTISMKIYILLIVPFCILNTF